MKRILAILRGKLDEVKLQNKIKRVENALAVAVTNAESDKIAQDDKLSACVAKLTENDVDVNCVLEEMLECIQQKHTIDEALKYADELKEWLQQDVEIDE